MRPARRLVVRSFVQGLAAGVAGTVVGFTLALAYFAGRDGSWLRAAAGIVVLVVMILYSCWWAWDQRKGQLGRRYGAVMRAPRHLSPADEQAIDDLVRRPVDGP